MLDKNREYGYRYQDGADHDPDTTFYDVRFYYDPKIDSWVREERLCGNGEGCFWTNWNGYMVTEQEMIDELEES